MPLYQGCSAVIVCLIHFCASGNLPAHHHRAKKSLCSHPALLGAAAMQGKTGRALWIPTRWLPSPCIFLKTTYIFTNTSQRVQQCWSFYKHAKVGLAKQLLESYMQQWFSTSFLQLKTHLKEWKCSEPLWAHLLSHSLPCPLVTVAPLRLPLLQKLVFMQG